MHLYKETNSAKAIESQIMLCCKSLQHMIHFPKYTAVQSHIRRALSLLSHLLFHTGGVINAEVRKKVLLPVIGLINYGKFDRKNKQLLASVLELCRQKHKAQPEEEFGAIVTALEACIFDRGSNKATNSGGAAGMEVKDG